MAYSKKEDLAFIETGNYIYSNPLTRWITLEAHRKCARLREYDSVENTVVDLGCGMGDHFPYIKKAKIIGIDINNYFLNKAKINFPNADLRKENILRTSFRKNSVKSIICFSTLEHILPLQDALKEINRILSPGGEFIFAIPTEGMLYHFGRNLTTKRHVEKITGIDYDKLLAQEHVNKCRTIIKNIKHYFILDNITGVPFKIPLVELNIFLVGKCRKK